MSRAYYARLGFVALAVLGGLGYVIFLYLGGTFRDSYRVDAVFARAGQNLRDGSDVKMRGVLVGTVGRTEVTPDGKARVVMNMFPSQTVPSNVEAAIRAKTLFGEKFVELQIVEPVSKEKLVAGDVIPESRTTPPFEVETILTKAVPLLDAIDPVQFGAALAALAQGFVGNEQSLRKATVQGEQSLTQTERTLPELERNLQHLASFAASLDSSDDDLLRALDGLERAGRPLISNQADLKTVLSKLPALTKDVADILNARQRDLPDLSAQGAPVLELVASKAPQIPALVKVLDTFLVSWIADLTSGPYWRIFVIGPVTCNASTKCGPYGGTNPPPGPASAQGGSAAQGGGRAGRTVGPGTSAGALGDLLGAALPDPGLGPVGGKVRAP